MNRSSLQPPPPPEALDADEAYQKSYATAVRLLGRREHSEFELRHKLAARDAGNDVIERVIAELSGAGFLSDRRFADAYVRSRSERGFGPLRIRAELRERGIDGPLAQQTLERGAPDWVESASQQRARRFGPELPDDFATRAKQQRFLQQRGFTGDQIRAVFQR